ncbi:SGNH/GDSL hydrolase family protein [Patulibacter sp.]|uniref:SGNH/GDSL hydrolase family protein n=1 Tax=Patulibacter sp. TaxID=1912859 RepID=UPI002724085F|nr:SGNH/GDSL hydrolase family protein [Patulibacter sp.]MDO9410115.1 SGNH/GDSL hydrolase family protein [Patulibacter sp.]
MSRTARRAALALATLLAVLIGGPAAASAADRYVALGDSYSSGTGTRTYTNTACQRSNSAYPALLAAARPNTSLTFVACSGATTADVLANQISSVTSTTKLVSISIGGNDAGFADVLTECALPAWASNCAAAVTTAQNYIRNTLPAKLNSVYAQIKSRAPSAKVAVLGYPRIFNGEDCNAATFFSPADETSLNATADLMRTTIRGRAQAYGFSFGDVIPGFVGHAVCDTSAWLNGFSNPIGESYHPNVTGHRSGYLPVARAILG